MSVRVVVRVARAGADAAASVEVACVDRDPTAAVAHVESQLPPGWRVLREETRERAAGA